MEQDAGVEQYETRNGTIQYTYEHVEEVPDFGVEWYRITTLLRLKGRPMHKNVYFYPAAHLSEFFNGYDQTGEVVMDVRPIDTPDMQAHLAEYAGGKGD